MVTHDLHFVFLPAEQTLLDEDLVNGGQVEAVGADALELFLVVSDATARAAEGEGRTDDEREIADNLSGDASLFEGLDRARAGNVETDLDHALLKEFAVFALIDGVGFRADHLNAVFGENALLMQLH